MGELMRVWLIAILALTLGPLASDGTAQSQQPGDPWQFPALTQRKAFQRLVVGLPAARLSPE